jgi:transcription antitermination factor NusG
MSMEAWYVVQTQRSKERAVQARLAREELTSYLPLLRQWPRPAVGSDVAPMFPGYVFVHASPGRFHRISRTPGVHGLVLFGGEPALLDDSVIDFFRSREGADGIIRSDPLPSGSEVLITDGPLRGLVAVLDRRLTGRQRVLVLLDILQRRTRVEVPERWVKLA